MKLLNTFFTLFILFTAPAFAFDEAYMELVSKILISKQTIDEHAQLIKKTQHNRPLTGRELYEISLANAERLKVRKEAYHYFERSRELVAKPIKKDFAIDEQELKTLMKSLSVAVNLMDMTLYIHSIVNESKRLRRILNEKDSSFEVSENQVNESIKGAFSIKNRNHIRRSLNIYKRFYLNNPEMHNDPELMFADQVIQNSYYYQEAQERKNDDLIYFLPAIRGKLSMSINRQVDFLNAVVNGTVFGGSMFFGNLVGRVQKRKGLLFNNAEFLNQTQKVLLPLDILLEKTPFRLTDNFIPGYWGHAAIYLGSVDDLIRLDLWDHPLVVKHRDKLVDNRLIVEALRSGIELNSLKSFSNIDDFVVLRYRNPLTDQEAREHILRALSHLNKRYDFNFDVETGKTIVCSELHYRTFIDLNFKTTRVLSRSTISVDQVAELGTTGGPLYPVYLYLNGVKIESDIQEVFDDLLVPKPKGR